jgi:hypothetical protein
VPARIGLGIALAAVLGATLFPAGTERTEFFACILCGTRAWGDALANVLLFAPLGAALVASGRTGTRPITYGFALSCAVELAQTMIPGRDPSLGDVCFNTLGTVLGQGTAHFVARWATPDPRSAARLSATAALTAAGFFTLAGWLLAPALPASAFRAWYSADRPNLEFYHARVLGTTLGEVRLGPADLPNSAAVRRLLLAGAPLRIRALAGPPVRGLAPLFLIEDQRGDELLLVGPDRDDLVLRYRTRARALGLDQPDLRLRHALAGLTAGDTLRIEITRERDAYCLAANDARACGLGFTVGSGWALLLYPPHFPPWLQHLLGAGLVAGILLPVGFWARKRWETGLAGAILLAAIALLPGKVGLLPTPASLWLAAGSGGLFGLGTQWLVSRTRRPAR